MGTDDSIVAGARPNVASKTKRARARKNKRYRRKGIRGGDEKRVEEGESSAEIVSDSSFAAIAGSLGERKREGKRENVRRWLRDAKLCDLIRF